MAIQETSRGAPGKSWTRPFPPPRDFSSLSIGDLLEAREAYHVHLSNIDNVVATAIGRYRIHQDDWYATHPSNQPRPDHERKIDEPRTFENSVIRPWSWPCVLVLVKRWHADNEYEHVPKRLFLPDGRVVPTCVLLAMPDEELPGPAQPRLFPSTLVGGGYPVTRTSQGVDRLGTIACLVEREGCYYALTNRHVVGPDGGVMQAVIRDQNVDIGTSISRSANRVPMGEIFPTWQGGQSLINIDAGLFRVDDISRWTSQAYGIGEIGDPFDATEASLTLDLIGCPVRAYGASSGVLEGEIQALFVRYKTLNGFDYVSDLLIGRRKPSEDSHATIGDVDSHPGDSGALWFYDPPNNPPEDTPHDPDLMPLEPPPERGAKARRLRPIAMQWGGQRLVSPDGTKVAHAFATFISTVCRVLDIEIVRSYGTGHDEYWGNIGHFSIGWKACNLIDPALPNLQTLMTLNQRNIGFDDNRIIQGGSFKNGRNNFVPLADVPDYVKPFAQPHGDIQHFADIDIHAVDGGKPMLDQCVADPKNISATKWKAYFDGFREHDVGPGEGTLPFRVWQLFEVMVAGLKAGHVVDFVTAGGIMAHYVGDASQPLHCSWMHHGRSPTKKKIHNHDYPYREHEKEFRDWKKTKASDIHGFYEQEMLGVDTKTALGLVNIELGKHTKAITGDLENGWEVAQLVIDLMDRARKRLSPAEIIAADDPSLKPKDRAAHLWNNPKVRDATVKSLAESAMALAKIWASAWVVGNGNAIAQAKLKQFTEDELMKIYEHPKFAPGMNFAELVQHGGFEPPAH